MKIGLIVNTAGSPHSLVHVLAGIERQTIPPAEVVVAEDGARDDTARVVATFAERVPYPVAHATQEQGGFRRSRILNQAIARASSEYLVFLDGDSVPHPRFVADHAAHAERGCWVQGRRAYVKEPYVEEFVPTFGSVLAYALAGKMTGLGKAFRLPVARVKRDRNLSGVLGCNLGIWRDDLAAVNGYDEAYEGWGREDSDLAARLYHLGRDRKTVRGQALLYHLNHPAAPRDRLGSNDALLAEALRTRRVACGRGLSSWTGA